MPAAQSNGCPIHYEVEGSADKPALTLCNSLGTTLHMWDGQMPALTQHFRIVRYDRRGHGKSGVPSGAYTMEMLGRDALAVLDAAGVRKTNWCGLSMGGIDGRIRQEPHSGANLTLLDAAHIANVERAGEYTDAMLGFLRK